MNKVIKGSKAKRGPNLLTPKGSGRYSFRLFVAGATARSHKATLSVRQICESKLKGQYTLEVIDIYQQPELVRENQIVATPTLIKDKPSPTHRFIGNLAIVVGLIAELKQELSKIPT